MILFVFMLVGMIYGMNFDYMFELYWLLGYFMVVGMMVVFGFGLYVVFKYKGWF